ncbi:DNA-formamidopyrimidine glycosylase [Marvinbryantia formatexigens]|nr:DNA-formamidopyrimidine glycosylase [Marvinbryantia formatexigens]UWO23360.1 DNA-formamidopyrimidine glycosylase [Marvinbryantia formatexigens DSM 14469]
MPELAEVEMIRRVLEPQLGGRTVTKLLVVRPEVVAHPQTEQFAENVCGAVIERLCRRGKYLQIIFQNGSRAVVHLRMTGQLLVLPADSPPEKYTQLVLSLDDGRELRFLDMRRFGRWWFLQKDEPDTFTGMQTLGPEPSDERLTAGYLREKAGASRKAIKDWLLCQQYVAGIGNIYSDEILFAAGIYPGRGACSLTEKEWERLAEEIPRTMQFFVEKNEISAEDYLKSKGRDYRNTPYLQVYGHKGAPCPKCGAPLAGSRIAGRSSVYCLQCQK